MQRLAAASLLFLLIRTSGVAAQDDFSFEIMEPEVESVDKARYDEARQLLAEERYAEALAAYAELLADDKFLEFHADAQYDSAKALYRMGYFHSALSGFGDILAQGAKHKHFASSRDWLFYIARRVKDQRRVVALIATHADAKDLPAEYASDFNYQLARYHFLNAVEVEARREPASPPPSEGGGGDFNFTDDPLSPGDASAPTDESGNDDFNFDMDALGGGDDDGFSFDFDDLGESGKPKPKPKPRPRRGRPRPRRGRPRPQDIQAPVKSPKRTVPDVKPAPEPEPKPEPPAVVAATTVDVGASLKTALGHLERVEESFPLYAKALYLKGLVYFAMDDFEQAVDAFQAVVRMTNPRGGTVLNPKLREMAFFSLARIHYQFEQFRYAIFYYERIDRDSESWLDALFESSWAHFRLAEYEKALGNLITIQSPFFIDGYYPESQILKAITYYENCRYPESRTFLGEFKEQYGGVMDELARLLDENELPEKIWSSIETLEQQVRDAGTERSVAGAITARVLMLVVNDKRLAVYRNAIAEVDAERTRLAAVGSPFAGTPRHTAMLEGLDTRRSDLVVSGGALLGLKLRQELGFLKELTSKLVRIQFEITKQEKDALAASLQGENVVNPEYDYKFSTATDDERVYWPFEGEYWRDELGTYEYTLTRGCRPQSAEES